MPPQKVIKGLKQLQNTRPFELISKPYMITPNECRNIGAQYADSQYIVFVDNDIEYSAGWLHALETNADQNQSDMVAPLTFIGPPSRTRIHHAGGELVVKLAKQDVLVSEIHRLSNAEFGDCQDNLETVAPLLNEVCEFHCVLIRKKLWDRVGGLDERLTTREHMDLALRAKYLNSKVTFEKNSHITYLALSTFNRSDLNYFLFRWSYRLAIDSVAAFESNWNIKVNRQSLLLYGIGRRKLRAVKSCYTFLQKIPDFIPIGTIAIFVLEYFAMRRAFRQRPKLSWRDNDAVFKPDEKHDMILKIAARSSTTPSEASGPSTQVGA